MWSEDNFPLVLSKEEKEQLRKIDNLSTADVQFAFNQGVKKTRPGVIQKSKNFLDAYFCTIPNLKPLQKRHFSAILGHHYGQLMK